MSAVAFRLVSRNGFDIHGTAVLQVNARLSVEISTRPGIASIAVWHRSADRIACLRRWATADAAAMLEAVQYARGLATELVPA